MLVVRWRRDALTVADLANVTPAAQTLHSSQAALSRGIQSLEAWLGATPIDRSAVPTRLTPEDERLRAHAIDILAQIADARGEVCGAPARDHVRLALPYALATPSLPDWWANWARDRALSCSVMSSDVHDVMSALVAGSVDLLVGFHTPQQPIQLDPARFLRRELRRERLAPYVAPRLLEAGFAWQGRADAPIPLLMYSAGVYFSRLVELILETSPRRIVGRRALESDMSDVLRNMAIAGVGAAWRPDCVAARAPEGALTCVDDGALGLDVDIVAFRAADAERPAVNRLWSRLDEASTDR